MVPLGAVATVSERAVPSSIDHEDGELSSTLSFSLEAVSYTHLDVYKRQELGGGSLPAVRVELLPFALQRLGISSEDVRAALQAANANRPKGAIEGGGRRLQVYTPSPARKAAEYRDLVIAWRNGAAVRLSDVAHVVDGVENRRTLGLFNGCLLYTSRCV